MRAFVAIDLPEIVRDVLEDLQERIPAGRLLDPDTLHLTLARWVLRLMALHNRSVRPAEPRLVVALKLRNLLRSLRPKPQRVLTHCLTLGWVNPWAG